MQAAYIKQEKGVDDEVIKELPVYLSRALKDKLWLLQYPVRPGQLTYDHARFLEAQLKLSQHQLILSMEMNTNSASYDVSKGEQIALNVDGSRLTRDASDLYYNGSVMDRQSLSSTLVTPPAAARRYCVGLVSDGELHLAPVDAVLAMRPSFEYLDRSDKKGRQEARELGEDVSGDEDEPETPNTERVTVKFARPESDRAKSMREKSYHFLKRKESEKPWLPATVYKKNTATSQNEWQKLICSRTDDISLAATVTAAEYCRRLLPPEPSGDDSGKQSVRDDAQMALRVLRGLPLADQIRVLMTRLKICQFSALLALLPRTTPPADVVRILQQCALLVRGLWLVRSDVLYPRAAQSQHTGVPAELLARARDYMLYQWTQRTFVSREELAEQTRLPTDDVLELLQSVAELVPARGWRLRLKPDPAHERSYPEVVHRQHMLWEAKQQQLSKAFKDAGRSEAGVRPRRRRHRSQRDSTCSVSSDNESAGEAAAAAAERGGKQRRASAPRLKQEPGETPPPPPPAVKEAAGKGAKEAAGKGAKEAAGKGAKEAAGKGAAVVAVDQVETKTAVGDAGEKEAER